MENSSRTRHTCYKNEITINILQFVWPEQQQPYSL